MPSGKKTQIESSQARPIPESYWVIPGRLLAGEYPALRYSPESTRQRLDSFLASGFDTFVNLTCPDEAEDYSIMLQEQASYYGRAVTCLRFPIGDYGFPSPQEMTRILDAIEHALRIERKIYLHCYGGIGRTGTTVGCFLVQHGYGGEQALEKLAGWWRKVPKSGRHPHSPETVQQEQFVREWPQGEKIVVDL